MQPRSFDRQLIGGVELDVCFECKAIWFDQYESAQLTPGAVIALFKMIHEHREATPRRLADSMRCPHCPSRLVFTQDIQRTNRIAYHRCPQSHGTSRLSSSSCAKRISCATCRGRRSSSSPSR